jgi:hypothetical protein
MHGGEYSAGAGCFDSAPRKLSGLLPSLLNAGHAMRQQQLVEHVDGLRKVDEAAPHRELCYRQT